MKNESSGNEATDGTDTPTDDNETSDGTPTDDDETSDGTPAYGGDATGEDNNSGENNITKVKVYYGSSSKTYDDLDLDDEEYLELDSLETGCRLVLDFLSETFF